MLNLTQAKSQLKLLQAAHPEANIKTALDFSTPYELIVAVILSAQCTDKRVNMVTPSLFKAYPNFASLQKAPIQRIETLIKTVGLFHNKAKSLKGMATAVEKQYHGKLPQTREELQTLPGVGRKTANVILAVLYDIPALAVDTHVGRICNRLGWASSKDPLTIENQVTKLFPKQYWNIIHQTLIWHGRKICLARNPKCSICPVSSTCQFNQATT